MKKNSIITMAVATLCTVAFVSSCNKENDMQGLDNRMVNLTVNTKAAVETKSGDSIQQSQTFEVSENGNSLFITSSTSVNADNPFATKVKTKGSEKTADDITEGFSMYMFSDSDNKLYKSGIVKAASSSSTYWSFYDGSSKISWPEAAETGSTYSFVSYIAADGLATLDDSEHEISYAGLSSVSGKDAANSEDFLVAYTEGVGHDHKAQNLVDLNFYHPLAAVKFCVTSKVKKITMTNVRKGGTVKYNSVDPADEDDFKKAFDWTVDDSDDNLTQYSQEVSTADIDATTGYAVYEFFLVPHVFADENVKLTFDIEGEDGQVHQLSTMANNLGTSSWDPGYKYTYYVNEKSDRYIGISVSETFDGKVKSNVGVQNTMRSTVYVRAAVVATWETEKGKILSSFNGTIDYNVGSDSNWVAGDDGYYYYKKPLVGYTTTDPLVKSFTDSSTSADLNFQLSKYRLVWQILVEGVEFDDEKKYVGEAWPDVTVNGTILTSVLEVE